MRVAVVLLISSCLGACAAAPSGAVQPLTELPEALPAMSCPWNIDEEEERAAKPHWQLLAKRGDADVHANYSTRCAGVDWVELLVSPVAGSTHEPQARSQIETWLVRCKEGVGAWTATSYFSEVKGEGKYLGTADGFPRYKDFKELPQVAEICSFLAGDPPMEVTAE